MVIAQPNISLDEKYYWLAWERLRRNGSNAAGIDGVRLSEIEGNEDNFISRIIHNIEKQQYIPSNAKEVTIDTRGKKRRVSILTLEDRLIHLAIKCWLEPQCNFHPNSYAYQPGKSALQAVRQIEYWIQSGYVWIGETDIRSFFDEIDHRILYQQISYFTSEEDKILFILYLLNGRKIGIPQGSPLSPLLANIYLHQFDELLSVDDLPYVRFSDDLIIMDKDEASAQSRLKTMKLALSDLNLHFHPEKTSLRHIQDNFTFLGFTFTLAGKSVPEKGIETLIQKLRDVEDSIYEDVAKIQKYEQIIRGWQQYYQSIPWDRIEQKEVLFLAFDLVEKQSEIEEIYESICSKFLTNKLTASQIESLLNFSLKLNNHGDALFWFALLQQRIENYKLEDIDRLLEKYNISKDLLGKFFDLVFIAVTSQDENNHSNLIDWLIEHNYFSLADEFHTLPRIKKVETIDSKNNVEKPLNVNDLYTSFFHLFSGREDMFLVERLDEGKRKYVEIKRPWCLEDVEAHFNGDMTIAQYMIRSNKTLNYVVIDVDISKSYLQNIDGNESLLHKKRKIAFSNASKISSYANTNGFSNYIIDSGYRGYHIWFFFNEPIELKIAYDFLQNIVKDSGVPSEDIIWERFPKQKKLKEHSTGQAIKLPWGKHLITGKQGTFINLDGKSLEEKLKFLNSISKISKQQLLSYLHKERLDDLTAIYQEQPLPNEIKSIIDGCPVVRHFVEKVKQTSYLSHQERLLFLNIFAPLGANGHDFIHRMISFTMNYDKHTTQKFINRGYSKPISCVRIREHFPSLTSQLPCNCKFPVKKGRYPSPVQHHEPFRELLFTKGKSKIEQKQNKNRKSIDRVKNEIAVSVETKKPDSIQNELNQLALKLIELRKHQRGIEQKLTQIEEDLNTFFTKMQIDRMEIDLGILVKKETEGGIKWVIEL